MNMSVYMNKVSNIFAENRLLKGVMVLLLMITVVNSCMLGTALKAQKTIILPPAVEERMEFNGNSVSDSYIKAITRYVLSLAVTHTPGTARSQFDELLTLFDPEFYSQAREYFYNYADTVERTKMASVFYLQRMYVDRDRRLVEVSGNKKQYAEGVKVTDDFATYRVEYKIREGRFFLVNIQESGGEEG